MKKDYEIQESVMEALKWIPLFDANEIGVSVKNGIVTLSGVVDCYPKKIQAERSVRKLKDVKGIAEEIVVRVSDAHVKTDAEIAQAVLHELEWHSNLDIEKVRFIVENGIVTLEGSVDWDFQRKSAAKAIRNLKGIRSIINNIVVNPVPPVHDIEKKIQDALKRQASLKSCQVFVEVNDHKVLLRGNVNSLEEKMEAEKAVWSAPGVNTIENKIECGEDVMFGDQFCAV